MRSLPVHFPVPLQIRPLFLPLLFLLFAAGFEAAAQSVEFEPGRWNLEKAKVTEQRGRNCLTGTAFLNNVKLKDGVIDVDLLVTGATSYPGIIFRRSADGEFERIYLRPHRAGQYPDAVQYTPTFNGSDAWQLYNGPGYTAACELPPDNWIHLRLEFRDDQARLFIGGNSKPALVVQDLKHTPVHGSLGLDAPQDGSAYFSRFSYREDAKLAFPPPPAPRTLPGTITRWEISRVFKASTIDMERTPAQQNIDDPQWMTVESEKNGLVNVARYRGRTGQAADCIWARATILADDDGVRELQFGYSDAISIFCNGRPLYAGSSAYRQRDPSSLGIVGYFDAVYLPLEDGENEIMFCVAETFGGWGFMARDGDAELLDATLTAKWNITRQLRLPESVVYDDVHNVFYVSNFFDEGKEFISKVSPDGEILSLRWASGLNRPTGLAMNAGRLFAVERTGVAVINTETGVVEKRIAAKDAKFLNDIAFDEEGIGYVTDSRANRLLRLEGDVLAPWLEGATLGSPNGIHVENGELIIGNSDDATVKAMNLVSKQWRSIATLDPGCVIDGLTGMGDGRLLASDHAGRVFIISPSGEVVKTILDRSTTQRYCADFAYVPALHLLVIPSLQENSLTAYTLK
ncbi:MAG: hypothetical protein IH600_05045 [Bacteroidetes bacterium]|nr:hypothetical protein [Bacteroidota bacterium]